MTSTFLQQRAEAFVQDARAADYKGLAFFYNAASEHIIAEWTETDKSTECKGVAEDLLRKFFGNKQSFLAMAANVDQMLSSTEEANTYNYVRDDGKIDVTDTKAIRVSGSIKVEPVPADVSNHSSGDSSPEQDASNISGVDAGVSSLMSSFSQTDGAMFRRSTRPTQPRVKLEMDSSPSDYSNDEQDMGSIIPDWLPAPPDMPSRPPIIRKAPRRRRGRKLKSVSAGGSSAGTSQGRARSQGALDDDDDPLYCETCGKSFRNPYLLKMHLRTHSGERPFQCATCGKTFAQEGNLRTHSFIHTGVKPFGCTECDKRFAQKVHLKNHMLVHTGEKPHQCEVCGRTFSRPKTLAVHKLSHADGELHQCNSCNKNFTSRSLLREHQIIHLDKVHACVQCDKKFSCRNHLSRHLLTHSGIKGFKCDQCDKTFTQNSSLKRHLLLHTGSDVMHACEICGKKFLWKSSWLSHKLTHLKDDIIPLKAESAQWRQEQTLSPVDMTHVRHNPSQVEARSAEFAVGAPYSLLTPHFREDTSRLQNNTPRAVEGSTVVKVDAKVVDNDASHLRMEEDKLRINADYVIDDTTDPRSNMSHERGDSSHATDSADVRGFASPSNDAAHTKDDPSHSEATENHLAEDATHLNVD